MGDHDQQSNSLVIAIIDNQMTDLNQLMIDQSKLKKPKKERHHSV